MPSLIRVLSAFALAVSLSPANAGLTISQDVGGIGAQDVVECSDPCRRGMGSPRGMPVYGFHAMAVSLTLVDTPLSYAPPVGPGVAFTLRYLQREAFLPATPVFGHTGPKWTHDWLAWIVDDPADAARLPSQALPGGGWIDYRTNTGYFQVSAYDPEPRSGALLHRVSSSPIVYERHFPDGTREIYAHDDGAVAYPRRIFLSSIVDRAGNTLTLSYDAQQRLASVTDAIGQVTTLAYDATADPLRITAVTDPFGRSATLGYDTQGRLVSITDQIGLTSSVTYSSADPSFVETLTTPYGTTRFAYAESGVNRQYRWLTATDPLGQTERIEFADGAPGIPVREPDEPAGNSANNYLDFRNSFYWDKAAHAAHPGDYTRALIRRWTLNGDGVSHQTSGAQHSVRYPDETRIYFAYPGQIGAALLTRGRIDQPASIYRLLPDGQSYQLVTQAFNDHGNPTFATDAGNRQTEYEYAADGIRLLTVRRPRGIYGTDTLAAFTYAGPHALLPDTATDAAGRTTNYTYNARGQLTGATNALGQSTSWVYDSSGYLLQVLDAQGQQQAATTWDAKGRVATATDAGGHTLAYQYDDLDRLTVTTWPDGSTEVITWDRLHVAAVKDRLDRTTSYAVDANGELTTITDPLGRITRIGRDPDGRVARITDAKGQVTQLAYDLEGRITRKTFAGGDEIDLAYDRIGRLASRTDSAGRTTTYAWQSDDLLAGISYSGGLASTAPVSYSYDEHYRRLVGMTDATGATSFAYHPAGADGALQLAAETGAVGSVGYGYDALGRVASRSVAGAIETIGYDAIGRVDSVSNVLGGFTTGYLGQTGQPTARSLAGAAFSTSWSYTGNALDRQLAGIAPSAGTQLALTPDAGHRLMARTLTAAGGTGGATALAEAFGYDAADRLTSKTTTPVPAGPLGLIPQPVASFDYDPADNLTLATEPGARWAATHTVDNQVLIGNLRLHVYDGAGNLTADGRRIYSWDHENRLSGVTELIGLKRSVFVYDGLGRRTRITDTAGLSSTSTDYLYCGIERCAAIGAGGTVTRRYFDQGEWAQGQALLYTTDQIGSVLDVVSPQNSVLGSRRYAAYGTTTHSSGVSPDRGYAGMLLHHHTGLYLTQYRVYDPGAARWLSRDPIGEEGGLNLYGYANVSPTNFVDRDGRIAFVPLLVAGYALAEAGLSIYDTMSAISTIADPCASTGMKIAAGGGAILGIIAPGAGYGAAARETVTVQRWMSNGELKATQMSGLLRGGRAGTHYVTDAANSEALRARQRLALPQTPEVRVTMEVPRNALSAPSRVQPAFNMPGGGMERTATGNVPVRIIRVD